MLERPNVTNSPIYVWVTILWDFRILLVRRYLLAYYWQKMESLTGVPWFLWWLLIRNRKARYFLVADRKSELLRHQLFRKTWVLVQFKLSANFYSMFNVCEYGYRMTSIYASTTKRSSVSLTNAAWVLVSFTTLVPKKYLISNKKNTYTECIILTIWSFIMHKNKIHIFNNHAHNCGIHT